MPLMAIPVEGSNVLLTCGFEWNDGVATLVVKTNVAAVERWATKLGDAATDQDFWPICPDDLEQSNQCLREVVANA